MCPWNSVDLSGASGDQLCGRLPAGCVLCTASDLSGSQPVGICLLEASLPASRYSGKVLHRNVVFPCCFLFHLCVCVVPTDFEVGFLATADVRVADCT